MAKQKFEQIISDGSMVKIESATFKMGMPEDDRNKKTAKKNKERQNPLTPDDDEMPEHSVMISYDFEISKYAVTQALWQVVTGQNPSHFSEKTENHPVEMVSWLDCIAFCNKLSELEGKEPVYYALLNDEKSSPEEVSADEESAESESSSEEESSSSEDEASESSVADEDAVESPVVIESEVEDSEEARDYSLRGYEIGQIFEGETNVERFDNANDFSMSIRMNKNANGYRLLTEAEWEYVARDGQLSEKFDSQDTDEDSCVQYPEREKLVEIAFFIENSFLHTQPVGSLRPNSKGVYDMYGNVWEWCWDYFDSYSANDVVDPIGKNLGSGRVIRGGAWNCYKEKYLRVTTRGAFGPGGRSNNVGLRLARTLHK